MKLHTECICLQTSMAEKNTLLSPLIDPKSMIELVRFVLNPDDVNTSGQKGGENENQRKNQP